MKTQTEKPVVVGPLLGYYVSCETTSDKIGHYASASVFREPGAGGEPLARLQVGPVATSKLAKQLAISTVRWQIENGGGECAHLPPDYRMSAVAGVRSRQ